MNRLWLCVLSCLVTLALPRCSTRASESVSLIFDTDIGNDVDDVQDIINCRKLANEWPTPVVWSGFEIGIALPYPAESIEKDFGYVSDHPLAEAYRRYETPPHNRPTWDLTSVLYAVHPDRNYFDLSPAGRVIVEEDGFTKFEPHADGRHHYLKLTEQQRSRVLEALVQLSSQPPN